MQAIQREGLDLHAVFRHGRLLCKGLFACPKGAYGPGRELSSLVTGIVHGRQHDFPFLIGLPEQQDVIHHMILDEGCKPLSIPARLSGEPRQQRQHLRERVAEIEREITAYSAELDRLRVAPDIAAACANIDSLTGYLDHAASYLTER